MIKTCAYCSERFESKREDAKFCSNGCRQMGHRKRHSISIPIFSKKEEKGIGGIEPQLIVPKRETSINPEYAKLIRTKNELSEKKRLLLLHKKNLIQNFEKISRSDPNTQVLLEGAVLGGGLTYAISEKPNQSIGGAMAGAVLWALLTGDNANAKKQARLNEIKGEIDRTNQEIDSIELSVFYLERNIDKTPRSIPIKTDTAPTIDYSKVKLSDLLDLKETAPAPLKTQITPVLSAKELSEKQFNLIQLKGIWAEFIGQPEFGFSLSIYGLPGQGKSTFAILLAKYLTENHGKVLFNSSEEKHSKTLQNKLLRLNAVNDLILISSNSTAAELREQIKNRPSPFVIIDSVDHMKASAEDIENLKKEFSKVSFILIHQSTKDGKQKGSNEFTHNADIVVRVENGKAITEKNRYAPAGKQFSVPILEPA